MIISDMYNSFLVVPSKRLYMRHHI